MNIKKLHNKLFLIFTSFLVLIILFTFNIKAEEYDPYFNNGDENPITFRPSDEPTNSKYKKRVFELYDENLFDYYRNVTELDDEEFLLFQLDIYDVKEKDLENLLSTKFIFYNINEPENILIEINLKDSFFSLDDGRYPLLNFFIKKGILKNDFENLRSKHLNSSRISQEDFKKFKIKYDGYLNYQLEEERLQEEKKQKLYLEITTYKNSTISYFEKIINDLNISLAEDANFKLFKNKLNDFNDKYNRKTIREEDFIKYKEDFELLYKKVLNLDFYNILSIIINGYYKENENQELYALLRDLNNEDKTTKEKEYILFKIFKKLIEDKDSDKFLDFSDLEDLKNNVISKSEYKESVKQVFDFFYNELKRDNNIILYIENFDYYLTNSKENEEDEESVGNAIGLLYEEDTTYTYKNDSQLQREIQKAKEELANITRQKRELEIEKATLEDEKRQLQEFLTTLTREKTTLSADNRSKQNTINEKLQKINEINIQLQAKNNEIINLKAQITTLESEKETTKENEDSELKKEADKIGEKILEYLPYIGFGLVALILVLVILRVIFGLARSGRKRKY